MKIRKKIRDVFMKKQKVFLSAAFFVVFLIAMFTFIFMNINKVEAIAEVSINSTTINVSDENQIYKCTVSDGTYTIVGDGLLKNNVSLQIIPANENVSNVTIVVEKLNIANSEDMPVLSFKPAGSGTTCNYTLKVSGDNTLSINCANAKSAVIEAQSLNASLVKLSESETVGQYCRIEDLLTVVEKKYETVLTITDDGSDNINTLNVKNTSGYGAGIGSSESSIIDNSIQLSPGTGVEFSPMYGIDANGNSGTFSAYDYLKELDPNFDDEAEYYLGQEFFLDSTPRASSVKINGTMDIKIESYGYGAAIGGGGSNSIERPAAKAGDFTLTQGTVSIYINDSNHYGIGGGKNSGGGENGSAGKTIIDGGSLYFNTSNNRFQNNPVNSHGERLYEFVVDVSEATEGANRGFDIDTSAIGQFVVSNDLYDSQYTVDYAFSRKNDSSTGDYTYGEFNFDTDMYVYKGRGHAKTATASNKNNLFVYLPATPKSLLTISDSSYITSTQTIRVFQNDDEKFPQGSSHVYGVGAGKNIAVRVYDVPNTIEVSSIKVGEVNYPVTKNVDDPDNPYYVASFVMPENGATVQVVYGGEIEIEYKNGFIVTDVADHGYQAPSETTYSYGQTLVLKNPTVNDLVFEGWYLTGTTTKITQITSADMLDGSIINNGKISLTAKWSCEITTVYAVEEVNNGQDVTVATTTVPYGSTFTLDPSGELGYQIPSVQYYDFIGFTIDGTDGTLYSAENGRQYTKAPIVSKLTVRLNYKKNRYFIYIDKEFYNATDIYVMMGATRLEADRTSEYNENGHTYYRVLITDAVDSITLNISAKYGYEISPTNWSIGIINANSFIDNWQDNAVAYTIGLDGKDVYVNNNSSSFIAKEYTIQFFDGVNSQTPWKEYTYTIETMELPATLAEILGSDYISINSRYDRYHKFTGFKSAVANGSTDPYVTEISTLGNYIFVANWEEIDKFALDITVYDSKTNEVSPNIIAIPYLYDEVYDSKYVIDITEEIDPSTGETRRVAYVIPNDKVYFEFVAIDSNGQVMTDQNGNQKVVELGQGIMLASSDEAPYDFSIKYEYTSNQDENTVKKIRNNNKQYINVPDDVKDRTYIDVDIRVELSEFKIEYWDLRGYSNDSNRIKYTIFDEFEFVDIVDGIPWLVVVQDNDDTNFDEVTTVPISGIDMWSTGNLVLKPDWPSGYTGLYSLTINIPEDAKGSIEIIYPQEGNEFKAETSIFIRVNAENGYKLLENSLCYEKIDTESDNSLVARNLRRVMTVPANNRMIVSPVNESEGLYLFLMPSSDIVLTADFVIRQYNIIYDGIDEEIINTNPLTYTVEDEIVLREINKEGYKFDGFVDELGNPVSVISKGNTGDIVLYPKWSREETETTSVEETTSGEIISEDISNDSSESGDVSTSKAEENGESETTKNMYIGDNGHNGDGGQGNLGTQTGDNTNVVRLILICVVASVALIILVIKKKDTNDEEQDEE